MQNQKKAAASKARPVSETLILDAASSLAFRQVVDRFLQEEEKTLRLSPDDQVKRRQFIRRGIGNKIIESACSSLLNQHSALLEGFAWWKFELTQQSEEEMAAESAMFAATSRWVNLEPISEAEESLAIRELHDKRVGRTAAGRAQPLRARDVADYLQALTVEENDVEALLALSAVVKYVAKLH